MSGVSWGGANNSPSSAFFLPLEGGGSEVGVKICPLTPTLSHDGERENEVKYGHISPASQRWSPTTPGETFCEVVIIIVT
jgi:hypothetical protein